MVTAAVWVDGCAAVSSGSAAADTSAPDDLRMDAAEGLAELQTPPALELLQNLARGPDSELAQLCRELLAEVASAHAD